MTRNSFGARGTLNVNDSTFEIFRLDGLDDAREFTATVRIDTPAEAAHFVHGGILPYVLRQLLDTGT